MIHDIDLVQMIVGTELASVDAIGTPVFSGEIDIANARLKFEGGCVANVTASRVSLKSERKLRVFCDDAYMSLDLQQKILTVIRKRDGEPSPAGNCRCRSRNSPSIRAMHCWRKSRPSSGPSAARAGLWSRREEGLRALRTAIAIS